MQTLIFIGVVFHEFRGLDVGFEYVRPQFDKFRFYTEKTPA